MGFSYLGRGVSLQGCSSKAQPLLLTLDEGYLLTAAPPGLERGIAPLGSPGPAQPPLLGGVVAPPGLKGEIDSNTIIVGDFNIPLTSMDRSSKWKINKEASLK